MCFTLNYTFLRVLMTLFDAFYFADTKLYSFKKRFSTLCMFYSRQIYSYMNILAANHKGHLCFVLFYVFLRACTLCKSIYVTILLMCLKCYKIY